MEGPRRRSTRWHFFGLDATRRFKRRGKKWTQIDRRKVIATRSRPETPWLSLIYCSKNLRWNSRAEAASLRKAILCLFFLSWETLCALSHTYRDAQANIHTCSYSTLVALSSCSFIYLCSFELCWTLAERCLMKLCSFINHTGLHCFQMYLFDN